MKVRDLVAVAFLAILAILLIANLQGFIALTKAHPYLMGFLKFGLLATWGEALKSRMKGGPWWLDSMTVRAVVWGAFGIWITAAIAATSVAVPGLMEKGLWFQVDGILLALSKSIWINILFGYAFFMMLTHEYLNRCIDRGTILNARVFAQSMTDHQSTHIWFRFIPKTIVFFWVPAHTITFSLPAEWQVVFAAGLSIVLGFLLNIVKRH